MPNWQFAYKLIYRNNRNRRISLPVKRYELLVEPVAIIVTIDKFYLKLQYYRFCYSLNQLAINPRASARINVARSIGDLAFHALNPNPSITITVFTLDTDTSFVNREKRFEVNELIGFDAVVRRDGSDEGVYYASLIDFSRRGGKFELPFCARFDEVLNVKFEFKDSAFSYSGSGRVRHMRNVGENRWQVGCSLDPPLPEDVVSHLAKRTNQERRTHPRFEICGEGILRRQGTPGGCDAVIRNISRGGFCLIVPLEHDIGEKVDFVIAEKCQHIPPGSDAEKHSDVEEKLNVGARIRWQSQTSEGYSIGCSFTDAKSYTKLVDYLVGDEQITHDKTSWTVLATAFLALLIPIVSSLVSGAGKSNAVQLGNDNPKQGNVLQQSIAETSASPVAEHEEAVSDGKSTLVESQNKLTPPSIQGINESPIPFEIDTVKRHSSPKGRSIKSDGDDGKSKNPAIVKPARPKWDRSSPTSTENNTNMVSTENNSSEVKPMTTDARGIPNVLTDSAPLKTKKTTDRGSSRRVRSNRPIIVESEPIVSRSRQ